MLFLDDVHWSDSASLELLAFLARRLAGRPFLLLLTWRGEELAGEHPLRALLAQTRRAGTATAITLPRLTRSEVSQIVGAGPLSIPAGLDQRIYEETEGVPFFVVEYLRSLAEAAPVAPAAGQWPMPHGVRDLLQARLTGVGETERQLLQAGATAGRAFDFALLQAASGRSEEEAVSGLERLLARGLWREQNRLE